jgi:hypothetical protein
VNTPGDITQRSDGHTDDPRNPGLGWRSLAVLAGTLILTRPEYRCERRNRRPPRAFFILYPTARICTLLGIFFVKISAWVYLGAWFLYQLVEGNFGLASASANGGGSVVGVLVTLLLLNGGRVVPQSTTRRPALTSF